MRRQRQLLPTEEAFEILRNGKTAVPLNYAFCEGKIYFHCAKEGHKIDALRFCPKVSLCVVERDDIIPEKFTTAYKSVIVFGTARILESEDEVFKAAEILALHCCGGPKEAIREEICRHASALCCVEIAIDHLSGKCGSSLAK